MPATLLLSSHSELDPPLPIPNRAVKRLSADDSADYPCESRTLLGSLSAKKPSSRGLFCFGRQFFAPAQMGFRFPGAGPGFYSGGRRQSSSWLDRAGGMAHLCNAFRNPREHWEFFSTVILPRRRRAFRKHFQIQR